MTLLNFLSNFWSDLISLLFVVFNPTLQPMKRRATDQIRERRYKINQTDAQILEWDQLITNRHWKAAEFSPKVIQGAIPTKPYEMVGSQYWKKIFSCLYLKLSLPSKLVPIYLILFNYCVPGPRSIESKKTESSYLRSHILMGESQAYKPIIFIFYNQVHMKFGRDTMILILNRLFCVSISSSIL